MKVIAFFFLLVFSGSYLKSQVIDNSPYYKKEKTNLDSLLSILYSKKSNSTSLELHIKTSDSLVLENDNNFYINTTWGTTMEYKLLKAELSFHYIDTINNIIYINRENEYSVIKNNNFKILLNNYKNANLSYNIELHFYRREFDTAKKDTSLEIIDDYKFIFQLTKNYPQDEIFSNTFMLKTVPEDFFEAKSTNINIFFKKINQYLAYDRAQIAN